MNRSRPDHRRLFTDAESSQDEIGPWLRATLALTALIVGTAGTTVGLFKERATRQELERTLIAYREELKRAARDVAMTGDDDQTERPIERAMQVGAGENWADFIRAQFGFYRGNWAKAIELLESVLEKDPHHLPALAILCESHLMNGTVESWADLLPRLNAIEPANAEEILLKSKAMRSAAIDSQISLGMIERLPNWRTSPWARLLRAEVLMYRANRTDDVSIAEDSVKEAFVAGVAAGELRVLRSISWF